VEASLDLGPHANRQPDAPVWEHATTFALTGAAGECQLSIEGIEINRPCGQYAYPNDKTQYLGEAPF